MKRIIFLFILIISMTSGCRVFVSEVWTSDGFGLREVDNEYYILKYKGNNSEITIPDEYKGKRIVGLRVF